MYRRDKIKVMEREPKAIDVYLDESFDKILKTAHCWGCGFVLMQHFGRVKIIIPATAITHHNFNSLIDGIVEGKTIKPPGIIQCHNKSCRMRYNIR